MNETAEEVILGTKNVSSIDTEVFQKIVDPLDRMLTNYRGQKVEYRSASTVTVTAGGVSCTNSGGTINTFRANTSDTSVGWGDIDTGAEASSTVYYIYAVCDTDVSTNTYFISISSTAPTGATLYKKLGQFTNNSASTIEGIKNVGENRTTVAIVDGTISNGGTISLPSGFSSSDQCAWTVSLGSGSVSGSHPDGVYYISTVNTARVATCTYTAIGGGDSGTTTCNYIIACSDLGN